MAHYSIYLPDKVGANVKHLKDAGLGSLVRDDDQQPEFADLTRGPDGGRGLLVIWRTHDGTVDPSFDPDSKTWIESDNKKWWLGLEKESECCPRDLARKHQLFGYNVTMADGFTWHIPAVTKVPHYLRKDERGELVREVKDDYRWYCEQGNRLAMEMFQALGMFDLYEKSGRETVEVTDEDNKVVKFKIVDGLTLISHGLELNYRVTEDILYLMRVFDNESLTAAFSAVIDWAELNDSRGKKKAAEELTLYVT